MARIIQNKKAGTVIIHATATDSIEVVGNTAVSNLAISDEELTGATIRQVWFGGESQNSHWTIKRGANTVAVYNGTGHIAYFSYGTSLNLDASANLVLTHTGGSNSYIMVELQKLGTKPTY